VSIATGVVVGVASGAFRELRPRPATGAAFDAAG